MSKRWLVRSAWVKSWPDLRARMSQEVIKSLGKDETRVMGKIGRIKPCNKLARLQEGSLNLSQASVCQFHGCQRQFKEKRPKDRKQLFCSITCRVRFFQEARIVGASILKKALTDPEAENYIRNLLAESPEDKARLLLSPMSRS